MDAIVAAAGVISACAALGALYFAYKTVVEARELRKEEARDRARANLQRVAELVGDVGEDAMRAMQGSSTHLQIDFPLAQGRLGAALANVEGNLPACRALLEPTMYDLQANLGVDDVRQSTLAALDEVRVRLETEPVRSTAHRSRSWYRFS
jgi:hypothetical protein